MAKKKKNTTKRAGPSEVDILREALQAFVTAIDNLGGVRRTTCGIDFYFPPTEENRHDIADAYLVACEILDREPIVSNEGRPTVCDNCGLGFKETELKEPKDLWDRVEPGSEVPAGECPECGALCYLEEHDSTQ